MPGLLDLLSAELPSWMGASGPQPVAASPNPYDGVPKPNFDAEFGAVPQNQAALAPGNFPLPQARPPTPGAPLSLAPPGVLPQASAPTQGPAPQGILSGANPAPVPPASLAGRMNSASPGFGDRMLAALSDFGVGGRMGGLLGAISGGIQGATTGQRFDPLGLQNQTMQALVNRGIPQDMAAMVANNPSAMQQILPRLMGAKQWQLGETTDILGQKKPFLYDPVSGQTMQLNFNQQQPAPAQNAGAQLVRQNGHVYQRQPNGSYVAIQ